MVLPQQSYNPLPQAAVRSLDGIIDTVSAKHEISQLLPLLDVDGTLVLLGVPPEPHTFAASSVHFSRCAPRKSELQFPKPQHDRCGLPGSKMLYV